MSENKPCNCNCSGGRDWVCPSHGAPKSELDAPSGSAYLVDCNPYGNELVESKTISEALAKNRIVSVSKEEDGRFCVQEGCDEYFRGYLTRQQLLAWAEELKALAGASSEL